MFRVILGTHSSVRDRPDTISDSFLSCRNVALLVAAAFAVTTGQQHSLPLPLCIGEHVSTEPHSGGSAQEWRSSSQGIRWGTPSLHKSPLRIAVLSSLLPQGWSVEARQAITKGSFVAEYVGEYVSTPEALRRLSRYDELEAAKQTGDGLEMAKQTEGGSRSGGAGEVGEVGEPSVLQKVSGGAAPSSGPQQLECGGDASLAREVREWNGCALLVVREELPSGLVLRANIDATLKGNVARFINHRWVTSSSSG